MSTDKIIKIARSWCDTPYQHQASVKGVGADCLGLIRGIYRELYGQEAATVPAYQRRARLAEGEVLWHAAAQYLQAESLPPKRGYVLLFRLQPQQPARHLGVLSGTDTMIHAAHDMKVCEVHYHRFWQKRLVACFSFSAVKDNF